MNSCIDATMKMLFSHILPSAIDGLIHIADCLLTHICHGFSIPSAVTQDLVDRIAAELEFTWYSLYSYPSIQEYSKAGIGFLIAEMWQVRIAKGSHFLYGVIAYSLSQF